MKSLAFTICIGLCAVSAFAQETSHFAFSIGGGFTNPVGNTGRHLDEGWNIQGGAGYNFSPYVGPLTHFDSNSFGINAATLITSACPVAIYMCSRQHSTRSY